jgi:hypothetical protein
MNTKQGEQETMVWGEEQEMAFKEIRRAWTNTPAVGLQDVMKPFFLYVHGRLGTAVGDLTQLLVSWHHQWSVYQATDAVSRGWLPCLYALVATAVLVAEADKLTLGQELTVSHCFDSYGI